jgi:hypothetical protein
MQFSANSRLASGKTQYTDALNNLSSASRLPPADETHSNKVELIFDPEKGLIINKSKP